MLVLLFDTMEFGIVGGYLSKLCVTLPHMSIPLRDVLRFPGTAEKAVEIIQD